MTTPDIPVLTKVHNKPKGNESNEPLNMAQLVAQVKLALLPELQTLIQQQLLQTAPDFEVDTSLIEKQLQEAQLALMTQARKDMEQEGTRLTSELTEGISQDISDKILGMQELAVNQARSQIGNSIISIEEGFKEAIETHAKQQEQKLADFFEQQAQQTKAQMADKAKSMSDQLLDAVNAYSQKLAEEGKTKLQGELERSQTELFTKTKDELENTFARISQTQQGLFAEQLTAKLPEFQAVLAEHVKAMVAEEMNTHMSAIEKELTSKLKMNIVEVLQGIKFVFPNGNTNSSNSAGGQ